MKPKYLLTVIAIVAITKAGFAQYSQDALRFSNFQTGSTARIKGIGNAQTAIGGDLSSISGNPAGVGFFTHSEMSITPEFDGSKIKSTYFNQNNNTSKSNLNLNNIAAVFYSQLNTPKGADKTKGWLSLNFGVAYDRTNNYYEDIRYGGTNKSNSITDYYAQDGNTNQLSDGSLGLWAYNQNLIDQYTSAGNQYRSNATYPPSGVNPNGVAQLSNAIRTGGQSELSLSMGANYSNQLYLGFSVGITNLRYNTTNTFTENGIASVITSVGPPIVVGNQNYANVYSQDQETKGTGFNLKAGVIYKATEAVRLGASITTPTWYNIDDNYNEGMSTKLNGNNLPSYSNNYPFSYKLQTPTRVAGGVAIFLKQFGFISGDVEYLDYSASRLSGDYSSNADNNDIKVLYQSAINAHVGAEARLASMLFLRGGYGVQGNALKANGSDINTVSGGLGFRSGTYYIDATYSHITGSQTVFPYEIGTGSPSALLNKTNDNVYVTVGFRF